MRVYLAARGSGRWLPKWAASAVSMESKERSQVIRAVAGFKNFESIGTAMVDRRKRLFFRLNKQQQREAIRSYERYRQVRSCLSQNSLVLEDLASSAIKKYGITTFELLRATPASNYEVLDTFNHLVRDWSQSTASSREQLFEPILSRLSNLLPSKPSRVLVPGSGVGRLAHEIAKQGHSVDAPEFSATMHLGAQFATSVPHTYSIYPYLLEFSHLRRSEDQFETSDLSLEPSQASFHYADFLKFDLGYKYDAIVTLFFIDTAENVMDYIERIESMIAPGGVWINYGPLKWGTAPKVEFAMDELIQVIQAKGWQIQDTFDGSNRYSGSPQSLWEAQYRLSGWTAKRSA